MNSTVDRQKELRVKIAGLCGWTWDAWGKSKMRMTAPAGYASPNWINNASDNSVQIPLNGRTLEEAKFDYITALPDYCNDLNAMHEAEKTAGFHESDTSAALCYWCELGRAVAKPTKEPGKTFTTLSEINRCSATALQRAEAFVKTMEAK